MTQRWRGSLTIATLIAIMVGVFPAMADGLAGHASCVVNSQSGRFSGTAGLVVGGQCSTAPLDGPEGQPGPRTKVIDCGRPSSQDNGFWNIQCGAPRVCYDDKTDPKHKVPGDEFATLIWQGGAWIVQSVWCPAVGDPVPTTAAVREQVLRLLPRVEIGSAWPARALVNAETVLWAKTDENRTLRTVTVVGRRVQLRIGFDHATWTYGDGTSESTAEPGRAYDKQRDACNTAQCEDYSGHTYSRLGAVTLSLAVSWKAQFSLDNGTTWTDVDAAALTGPAVTTQLQLIQSRGVLVPNPRSSP